MDSSDQHRVPPAELWKFLPLANGLEPSWPERLTAFVDGKGWLSSPLDFNDPFDCLPHFPTPATPKGLEAKKQFILDRFVRAMSDLPPSMVRGRLESVIDAADPAALATVIQNSVRTIAGAHGVFCLSETIDSILMWSHYGLNHSGIALRFNLHRRLEGGLMPLFRVNYQDKRPAIDLFAEGDRGVEIADALATKASFWAYEREWRAIVPRAAHTFAQFDPAVIDGIVFGVNCAAENEARVRKLFYGHDIEFMRAKPSPDTFMIGVEPA